MIGLGSRLPSFRDEDRDLRGLWISWCDGASCLFVSRAFNLVLQQLQNPISCRVHGAQPPYDMHDTEILVCGMYL